jgi:hypothetical protein
METAYLTIQENDKLKREVITAHTPKKIHELFGKYLSKQFAGQLVVREFHYVRSGDE